MGSGTFAYAMPHRPRGGMATSSIPKTLNSMEITATPSQLVSLLNNVFLPDKQPVLVVGRPGIGKSDIINQVAKGYDLIVIKRDAVTDDPTDYKGLGMALNGEIDFHPFGDIKKLIHATKPTLCFFDDVGQATHATQAALMPVVLERRVGVHKISDHVIFIAATNRIEDKAGVNRFLSALLSRFSIVNLEPTLEDWVKWALNTDMPLDLINFCRSNPYTILEWSPSKGIENTPNPRNIESVGKMMNRGIPKDVELIAFASRLGNGTAVQLSAFLDISKNLPTIDEIILNPMGARIPTEPSAAYVIASAMVRRANGNTLDAIFKYMNRLPPEFTVMMAQDITVKRPELQQTKAWTEWSATNKILN